MYLNGRARVERLERRLRPKTASRYPVTYEDKLKVIRRLISGYQNGDLHERFHPMARRMIEILETAKQRKDKHNGTE